MPLHRSVCVLSHIPVGTALTPSKGLIGFERPDLRPSGRTSERTRALPHRGLAPVRAMVRPRQNHELVEAVP
jgi:hypothetical protein